VYPQQCRILHNLVFKDLQKIALDWELKNHTYGSKFNGDTIFGGTQKPHYFINPVMSFNSFVLMTICSFIKLSFGTSLGYNPCTYDSTAHHKFGRTVFLGHFIEPILSFLAYFSLHQFSNEFGHHGHEGGCRICVC